MINSGRCHDWLALAGLDHHEARAVEGQLEGLARAEPNEGAHREGALDLRLQVRWPADRCRWFGEVRSLRVVQTRRRPGIGPGAVSLFGDVCSETGKIGLDLSPFRTRRF